MKKILLLLTAVLLTASFMPTSAQMGRNDVLIPLDMIHTDAAFKQFKKATNELTIDRR